jgi:hypothetical protein
MPRNSRQPSRMRATKVPEHPIICDSSHRDTLDHVAHVIELLERLDLSEGLTPSARAGLYWVHRMLADTVKHVSDGLRDRPKSRSS